MNEIRQDIHNWVESLKQDFIQDAILVSYSEDDEEETDNTKSTWVLNGAVTYGITARAN